MPLRRYLAIASYNVHPWTLGRNIGGRSKMVSAVQSRIAEIGRATDRKVSVIGWSLGGVYARPAALAEPEDVRCVTTLGSGFANASGGYRNLSEINRRTARASAVVHFPSWWSILLRSAGPPTRLEHSDRG